MLRNRVKINFVAVRWHSVVLFSGKGWPEIHGVPNNMVRQAVYKRRRKKEKISSSFQRPPPLSSSLTRVQPQLFHYKLLLLHTQNGILKQPAGLSVSPSLARYPNENVFSAAKKIRYSSERIANVALPRVSQTRERAPPHILQMCILRAALEFTPPYLARQRRHSEM